MSNKVLTKNIISNYFGKIWSFASVYIFIPLYIQLLGIESYGVINFYAVFLSLMYFADAGLSATLQREVARSQDKVYLGNLLFTIERIYLFICIVIMTAILLLSPMVATYWLNTATIPVNDLSTYISMMGVSLGLQFFSTLYNGGLMGLQKQVLANSLQISWSFARSGLVLIPLFFSPSLTVFFLWQIVVNFVFLLLTRYNLWQLLKTDVASIFEFRLIKDIWKFAFGMMLMSVIVAVNTQLDKLLVSKFLSLEDFGYYSISSIFAQTPTIITTPIAIALLPYMTKLAGSPQEHDKLTGTFRQYSFIVSSIAAGVGVVLFLYTKDLLFIWTHNSALSAKVDLVAKILLLGGVFLAFQLIPYYLAIANGYNSTNIKMGLIFIVLMIPALTFMTKYFGMLGATVPWFVMNVVTTVLLGYILINKFLPGEFSSWICFSVLMPVLLSAAVGVAIYFLLSYLPQGYYVIAYAAFMGIIILLTNIKFFNLYNHDTPIRLKTLIRG